LIDILNLFYTSSIGLYLVGICGMVVFSYFLLCFLSCVYCFVFLFFFWTAAVQLIQVFSRHCGPPQAEPAVAL
jgi:hypothetical protein